MSRRRPLRSPRAVAARLAALWNGAAMQNLEQRQMLAVHIQFDYTYDTGGFFTDPSRRALLQSAADAITGGMTDSLKAIVPTGNNTWTVAINNPSTGTTTTIDNPVVPADTVLIYAGARVQGGVVLGRGGPAGFTGSGTQAWKNTFRARGQSGALATPPTDIGLAVGSLGFDTVANWHFGATTAGLDPNENDFLSVASHEIGHVLGIGTAASWTTDIANSTFTGPKSVALYGGPVPVESDAAHFLDGTTIGGLELAMDPSLTTGTRKTFTSLDFSALDDIGWNFDPVATLVSTDGDDLVAEPNNGATFRLARNGPTNAAVTINLAIGGTATRGTDYVLSVGGSVVTGNTITLAAGVAAVDVALTVIDDSLLEGDETVTLSVQPGTGYTVDFPTEDVELTIGDDEVAVSIATIQASAAEPAKTGLYRITRVGSLDDDLDVTFATAGRAKRGRDYTLATTDIDNNGRVVTTTIVGNVVTIPAGAATVDVLLIPIDDSTIERLELATVKIVAGATPYQPTGNSASVKIKDDDRHVTAVNATAKDAASTGNFAAYEPVLSVDGRYATYVSNSTNLVASPRTTFQQVYRRELVTGVNELVSIAKGGKVEANDDAVIADLSADGRYVAYETTATNLVGSDADENALSDVYVRDMDTGKVALISRNAAGAVGGQLVAISQDGQRILFTSGAVGSSFVKGLKDQNGADDLFVWFRKTGTYECVSLNAAGNETANRSSAGSDAVGKASFSADGTLVLFPSRASNLLATVNDVNTFQYDLFIRDLDRERTEPVSIAFIEGLTTGDVSGNAMSGMGQLSSDGTKVLFRSRATNLTGTPDANGGYDIFLLDRVAGTMRLLSTNAAGTAAANGSSDDADLAADGNRAVFATTGTDVDLLDATATSDIYAVDLTTFQRTLVSKSEAGTRSGSDASFQPAISGDGSTVVFDTYADDLPADTDKRSKDNLTVYSQTIATGENTVVSFDRGGEPATGDSYAPIISQDGTRIIYFSENASLVKKDVNGATDLFSVPTPGHESATLDVGVLTINGSPIADAINVQRVGTKLIVRRNNERYEFAASLVSEIDISTGDGADSILVGTNVNAFARVLAGDGNDRVTTGTGNDRIDGGAGNDTISTGDGDDSLVGGKGSDQLNGGDDEDTLVGGDSNDTLEGGGGVDRLYDGAGSDQLVGGGGNDRFYVTNDTVADLIFGGAGSDTIIGSDPRNVLSSVEATA